MEGDAGCAGEARAFLWYNHRRLGAIEKKAEEPDHRFFAMSCAGMSMAHVSVGEMTGIDIRPFSGRRHVAVRYSGMNWEPTLGEPMSNREYATHFGINGRSVESGAFLADLTDEELLSYCSILNGSRWVEERDFKRAYEAFEAAGSHHPRNTLAHFNKGIVLLMQENYKGAFDAFSAVLKLDPADDASYRGRAVALLRLGGFRAALDNAEQAVALRPSAAAKLTLALVYANLREYDKAVAYLADVAGEEPDNRFARALLDRIEEAARDEDRQATGQLEPKEAVATMTIPLPPPGSGK